ncbi:MAG: Fe-S cluster assembly ATPase SufC [Candidatus Gracilibacteria bacterium]
MLKITNLSVSVENKDILKDFSLEIKAGEIHAIMGPNGTGKSTLASVLAGKAGYSITSGEVIFNGKNLLEFSPEIRAREGLFLAFQHPVEIPGVSNAQFLKNAVNEIRKYRGKETLDAFDFEELLKEKMSLMKMKDEFVNRSFNEGFSGGEKKRNEILQMALLEPKLTILDEIDSGLDIDALRIVAEGINTIHGKEDGILMITHYQRLLDYITPDFVHMMVDGKIVKTGGIELAKELEVKGYIDHI